MSDVPSEPNDDDRNNHQERYSEADHRARARLIEGAALDDAVDATVAEFASLGVRIDAATLRESLIGKDSP